MGANRVVAVALLAFSVGYGVMAARIALPPFVAQDGVTARTMPFLLAAAGTVVSFLLVIAPRGEEDEGAAWRGLDWRRAGGILFLVLLYGALLRPAGFLVSTLGFLMACGFLLGERRVHVLAAVFVPIVAGFYWLMTRVLGQTL